MMQGQTKIKFTCSTILVLGMRKMQMSFQNRRNKRSDTANFSMCTWHMGS